MRDLKGKVAWVTGAGTGIGEGGAVALADAGMHVVLSGRRTEKLEEVAARCQGRASIEPLDVADKDAVDAVVQRILAAHGRIDVMVVSAGINVKKGMVSDMYELNVVQPLLVSTSAIRLATETVAMIMKIDDLIVVA